MNYVIILAAGLGQRMKMDKDKLFLSVHGKPIIYYSVAAFNDNHDIKSITIVANNRNKKKIEDIVKMYRFNKVKNIVMGGATRQSSLEKGLNAISAKNEDVILVHNGANPLPSQKEINQTIIKTNEFGACIVGHFSTATVKEVNGKHIIKTHDRKKIFTAETPQSAQYSILTNAINHAKKTGYKATDEAMLLEEIGQKIAYVKADTNNFKITTFNDYVNLKAQMNDYQDNFRVGIGSDSHSFEEKKKGLVLGGLRIPNELKLKANSDGDVILHAVFNAISQSLGDMSLGFYADPECEKGVKDSRKYLEIILKKMKAQKLKINSLGLMVEAKTPKIDPLVPKLKKSLAEILDTDPKKIGITATTGEELTAFGMGLGIQVFAIVSLIKE